MIQWRYINIPNTPTGSLELDGLDRADPSGTSCWKLLRIRGLFRVSGSTLCSISLWTLLLNQQVSLKWFFGNPTNYTAEGILLYLQQDCEVRFLHFENMVEELLHSELLCCVWIISLYHNTNIGLYIHMFFLCLATSQFGFLE